MTALDDRPWNAWVPEEAQEPEEQAPMPPEPATATVRCRAYREHQSNHRLIDGLWRCEICAGEVAQASFCDGAEEGDR